MHSSLMGEHFLRRGLRVIQLCAPGVPYPVAALLRRLWRGISRHLLYCFIGNSGILDLPTRSDSSLLTTSLSFFSLSGRCRAAPASSLWNDMYLKNVTLIPVGTTNALDSSLRGSIGLEEKYQWVLHRKDGFEHLHGSRVRTCKE